jgi:hypothetical protein
LEHLPKMKFLGCPHRQNLWEAATGRSTCPARQGGKVSLPWKLHSSGHLPNSEGSTAKQTRMAEIEGRLTENREGNQEPEMEAQRSAESLSEARRETLSQSGASQNDWNSFNIM